MKILFVDITCPKPYSVNTLQTQAMGGTEATVVRIAEGLAKHYEAEVYVAQHNRSEQETYGAEYIAFDDIQNLPRLDAVVTLRSVVPLPFLKKKFPDAKHVVWLHDLATFSQDIFQSIRLLEQVAPTVIGVSQFHKTDIIDHFMRATTTTKGYTVDYIHNPIDEELKPNAAEIDKDKLVFFSSPHKGLEQTLAVFRYVRERIPTLNLSIANPGYLPSSEVSVPGVTVLGPLSHADALSHVRNSLAVFYPNTLYTTRETFGLVFAEANAVGTPVIAHRMGAAVEVLAKENPPMDCNDVVKVYETVALWRENRPLVEAKPEFRLTNVLKKWMQLFRR